MYIKLPKIRRRRKTSNNPEQVYAARGGKMQRIDPELRSSSTPTELWWLSVVVPLPELRLRLARGYHRFKTFGLVFIHTL